MVRSLFIAILVAAWTIPAYAVENPPNPPKDGSDTASPPTSAIEVLPMPRENAEVTCPYLRQQKSDCHACQVADPDLGRDVLDNLKRLKQADELLESAKDLARNGLMDEALDCCARAVELCPGSPCAHRASETMLELAFGFVARRGSSEESTEPPTCPYCGKTGKPIREIVPEKAKKDANETAPHAEYEIEVGTSINGGLRLSADCTLSGNVYHLRFKQGHMAIWKTADAGGTKP